MQAQPQQMIHASDVFHLAIDYSHIKIMYLMQAHLLTNDFKYLLLSLIFHQVEVFYSVLIKTHFWSVQRNNFVNGILLVKKSFLKMRRELCNLIVESIE